MKSFASVHFWPARSQGVLASRPRRHLYNATGARWARRVERAPLFSGMLAVFGWATFARPGRARRGTHSETMIRNIIRSICSEKHAVVAYSVAARRQAWVWRFEITECDFMLRLTREYSPT